VLGTGYAILPISLIRPSSLPTSAVKHNLAGMRYLIPLLLLAAGCYGSPSASTMCRTNRGAFLSGSLQCEDFQRHEDVMVKAYDLNTPQWSADYIASHIAGIDVTVRSEVQHDAKGRAYWTDPGIPSFMIWGQTWCDQGRIDLADDNFGTGVLCHEFGHVFLGCTMDDHENMKTDGVNAAIAYVQKNYTTLSGATSSLDGETEPAEPFVVLTGPAGQQVVGLPIP
jgi:hypothetical protein